MHGDNAFAKMLYSQLHIKVKGDSVRQSWGISLAKNFKLCQKIWTSPKLTNMKCKSDILWRQNFVKKNIDVANMHSSSFVVKLPMKF